MTTIIKLALQALLGRRRFWLLIALPLALIGLTALIRALSSDPDAAWPMISFLGFPLVLPLVAILAASSVLGPEVDDGSIVYLLSKPVSRHARGDLEVAGRLVGDARRRLVGVFIAALVAGGGQQAVAWFVGALVAGTTYSALFLALSSVTRHAVVIGLIFVLIWAARGPSRRRTQVRRGHAISRRREHRRRKRHRQRYAVRRSVRTRGASTSCRCRAAESSRTPRSPRSDGPPIRTAAASGYECMPTVLSDERGPFGRNVGCRARDHRCGPRGRARDAGRRDGRHRLVRTGRSDPRGGCRRHRRCRAAEASPIRTGFGRWELGRGDEVRRCKFTNYCEALDQSTSRSRASCGIASTRDATDVPLTRDGRRRLVAPRWQEWERGTSTRSTTIRAAHATASGSRSRARSQAHALGAPTSAGPPPASRSSATCCGDGSARGGMGEVWAAQDDQLAREVAIKVVRVARWRRPPTVQAERLAREARALARMSDPHVVQVYDVGS